MSWIINDYKCQNCGKTAESMEQSGTAQIRCECGGVAGRVQAVPHFSLEGITGNFPTAADKWAKRHERAAHK